MFRRGDHLAERTFKFCAQGKFFQHSMSGIVVAVLFVADEMSWKKKKSSTYLRHNAEGKHNWSAEDPNSNSSGGRGVENSLGHCTS